MSEVESQTQRVKSVIDKVSNANDETIFNYLMSKNLGKPYFILQNGKQKILVFSQTKEGKIKITFAFTIHQKYESLMYDLIKQVKVSNNVHHEIYNDDDGGDILTFFFKRGLHVDDFTTMKPFFFLSLHTDQGEFHIDNENGYDRFVNSIAQMYNEAKNQFAQGRKQKRAITPSSLASHNVKQLYTKAQRMNIAGRSTMCKDELIKAIVKHANKKPSSKPTKKKIR